ncbi:MAG: CPBP family intramembrane metalloprotease [Candidatus Brocadiales bacterium]|nr:CPBP family intramembrane metalloprotease [Candidatus Brocadiales bacterium]
MKPEVFSVDNSFLRHYHFTMISFHNLKQYKKILLLFLLILCGSCLLAPLIKIAVDLVVPQGALMADLLNYKHGSYDFGKVMRRIILGVTILVIFLFRKPLMITSLSTVGIKHTTGWWEHLQMGFFLSTGIFILYTSFLFITGTKILQVDAKSLGDLFFQLFKFLLIAGLVGCIEEIFFRGFIFQSFLRDMQTVYAVCASSLFYSLLHFFRVKLLISPGFQPFIGFKIIYQSFANLFINFNTMMPTIIGIFLVGVVLSYACLRTNSLYFAIGLHAGWIVLIKTNILLFDHVGTNFRWLFGDSKVVTGVLGWGLLIVTLFLVRLVTKTTSCETVSYGKILIKKQSKQQIAQIQNTNTV